MLWPNKDIELNSKHLLLCPRPFYWINYIFILCALSHDTGAALIRYPQGALQKTGGTFLGKSWCLSECNARAIQYDINSYSKLLSATYVLSLLLGLKSCNLARTPDQAKIGGKLCNLCQMRSDSGDVLKHRGYSWRHFLFIFQVLQIKVTRDDRSLKVSWCQKFRLVCCTSVELGERTCPFRLVIRDLFIQLQILT